MVIVEEFDDDETQQINVCIGEMEKLKEEMENLKEKMETLEKQKFLNEQHEMLRKTTMEPNLKVLEKWLQDYRQAVEDNKKRQNDNKNNYNKYSYDMIKATRSHDTGIRTCHYYNEPSEVMEAHIEATYNMFNIINKRLDDIERKIEINK